ncbi:MAG: hypothetical protein MPEBLZ_00953 [Candidatus Methanoperedens nitroreducens]|uniref:Uncharacterized protein n=1 Tax=Candidatus Methanoperedens nitratireducens TaxID=1392998 RepID=A0A0P8CM82_9EURY|nr:MAG: hypothetical protein MPEBLZ_00953 [Candidatus Methanoperedens sp. BLZ1]
MNEHISIISYGDIRRKQNGHREISALRTNWIYNTYNSIDRFNY